MATQAELEAWRDALKRTRASGVTRVSHGNRSVEYRSLADLDRAIAAVEGELATLTGTPPLRGFRVVGQKGL